MVKRMIGLQVSSLFIVALAIISYISLQSMIDSYIWVKHSNQVLFQIHRIKDNLSDSQVSLREHVFGDDPNLISRYQDTITKIPQEIDTLQWLTRDNDEQQGNVYQYRLLIDRKLTFYRKVLDVYKTKGKEEAQKELMIGFGEPYHATVRNMSEIIENLENRLLDLRMHDYENKANLVKYGIPVLLIIYLLVFNVSLRMLTIKLQEQQ